MNKDDIVWDSEDVDWEPAPELPIIKPRPGFKEGFKQSLVKTLAGAGASLPEDAEAFLIDQGMANQEDVKARQAEIDSGGTGARFGQLVGDMGQLALGGTKLIPSTITAGLHGAAQNPDSPWSSGAKAAAGNLAGQGVFKVLKETGARVGSRLFKPTADTKVLMDQGIVPTLGRGSDPATFMGKTAQRAEDLAEVSRLTRGPLRAQIAQGDEALMQAALKRTGRDIPPGPLKDQVFAVGDAISKDYDKMFSGVKHTFSPELAKDLLGTLKASNLDPKTAKELQGLFSRFYVDRVKSGPVPIRVLDDFRRELRTRLSMGNPSEQAALVSALKTVDDRLTAELGRAGRDLKALDKQFAEYMPIERAMKSNAKGTPMTPEAYERGVRTNASAIGKSPFDPAAPGAALSGPASRTLTRPAYSEGSLVDSLIGVAASPVLRAGEWVTKAPNTRAWLMGDQKVKQAMIERLRRGGTPDWVMGIVGNQNMSGE